MWLLFTTHNPFYITVTLYAAILHVYPTNNVLHTNQSHHSYDVSLRSYKSISTTVSNNFSDGHLSLAFLESDQIQVKPRQYLARYHACHWNPTYGFVASLFIHQDKIRRTVRNFNFIYFSQTLGKIQKQLSNSSTLTIWSNSYRPNVTNGTIYLNPVNKGNNTQFFKLLKGQLATHQT